MEKLFLMKASAIAVFHQKQLFRKCKVRKDFSLHNKIMQSTRFKSKNTKFQELVNIHNPNKLSQHHRNILVVNVTYACPTLFSLPNSYYPKGGQNKFESIHYGFVA